MKVEVEEKVPSVLAQSAVPGELAVPSLAVSEQSTQSALWTPSAARRETSGRSRKLSAGVREVWKAGLA
jgi:hypothetical protein